MNIKEILDLDRGDDEVNPGDKIHAIIEEVEKLKSKIDIFLTDDSIDVHDLTLQCHNRVRDSTELIEVIVSFQEPIESDVIEDIVNTTLELQKISFDLQEADFSLNILNQLVECDEQLKKFNELRSKNELREAVTALSLVTDLLNNPVDGLEHLDIFRILKTDLVLSWELLLNDLSDLWHEYLNWSDSIEKNHRVIMVTINKNNMYDNCNVLEALISSKQIFIEIKNFARYLFRHILTPVILGNSTIQRNMQETDVLKVTIPLNNKIKPNYETVLSNLKSIFEYLHANFQYVMSDGNSLLRLIGSIICVDFSDILIKDCLVQTIPNCISELQDYGEVTSRVEEFQKYLTSINFFESENFSILQYTNNVDVLFANKTSQYFLESARNIMKKDLGNIMSVGTDPTTTEIIDNNDSIIGNPTEDESIQIYFKAYHTSPFLFPRCAISRSTQELLDLISVMMEQASEASDLCARRLYYTARNVVELYMAIVPLHFKQTFETMPQHVALFHNNTMFLAHNLLTFGIKWQNHLISKRRDYAITFCDVVKDLRDLATEKLLIHMRLQKKQILDSIRSSDLYYIATKDTLSDNAEQSIRQCIRQLQLLKTIWSGIFPPEVYRRLITCLANVFVEELISKVIIQEDITADVASHLSEIYQIVLKRLPQIYQENYEIFNNVTSWAKFNELILVLNGTLADIDERWFDGTGPLALQFKPEELKRLIRALFQNTTFRANILSKIK